MATVDSLSETVEGPEKTGIRKIGELLDVSTVLERMLQYYVMLTLAQSQSRQETRRMLDAVVPRWDNSFPLWRDNLDAALIEMARGQTQLAIDITVADLDQKWKVANQLPCIFYRHINFYKTLALEPAVAKHLTELDATANHVGEVIWAYITKNNLQL